MIFYTLKGPGHTLEIHHDKIVLHRANWYRLLTSATHPQVWEMQNLSYFKITIPQYILHGKIEWQSFDGPSGSFRFSTNAEMVKKIELYMQKCIIKNHQRLRRSVPDMAA